MFCYFFNLFFTFLLVLLKSTSVLSSSKSHIMKVKSVITGKTLLAFEFDILAITFSSNPWTYARSVCSDLW